MVYKVDQISCDSLRPHPPHSNITSPEAGFHDLKTVHDTDTRCSL